MTDADGVLAAIRDICRAELDDPALAVGETTRFADLRGWDSVAVAGVVMAAEERFGLRLSSEEIEQAVRVDDLARLVRARRTR
ncbi:MAG TPA: acyl carrier protein [Acetobacteraceae bacterium]|nr:acyl carrier protein [Acetobacteraceae bacterium]